MINPLLPVLGLVLGGWLVSARGPLRRLGIWAYDRGFLRGLYRRPAVECRTYWGTHQCRKARGHRGAHACEPGCPPPNAYTFGDDAGRWGL